jgi:hypothetical protein
LLAVVINLKFKKMIQDSNIDFRNDGSIQWIEGILDEKPKKNDIVKYCLDREFYCSNIKIWFDYMQQLWRFSSDIKQIKKCNWPYKFACSRFVISKNFCKTCEYFK